MIPLLSETECDALRLLASTGTWMRRTKVAPKRVLLALIAHGFVRKDPVRRRYRITGAGLGAATPHDPRLMPTALCRVDAGASRRTGLLLVDAAG